ncbi:MAG TPA: malto-oligosyltrehalose synthase, partial [Candidatus Acidoferrum sp.]|nr:malto-oligosyltrehalose synthase [Candidatus Acidoferrum sp.]
AGSTHGYDIVDYNALNPEIGTPEEYDAFVAALQERGMSHILDFVPNHMGVGGDDNAWWLDLLAWGDESPYADYFDVDWNPVRTQLRGKVLLPFLGSQYGDVLDAGDLRWEYDDGAFALRYYEHCFPLAPASYGLLLEDAEPASLASFAPLFAALERLPDTPDRREAGASLRRLLDETESEHARALVARLDDERMTPAGKALIERLIEAQHWRPASWKVAAEEINYRRFFDINGLAAVRMEHAGCFADSHVLVFDLLARGALDGLCLDHVDGLYDPIGYCDLLRSRAELLGTPMYLVVEKILAPGQELLARWNVDGTTGYEFMNAVTGIAIDRRNEVAFDRLYRRFTGDGTPFAEVAYASKKLVLDSALAAELNVLALRLDRIAQRDPHTRDFTLGALRRALVETIASFSIYRTYITAATVGAADRLFVDRAIETARARDTASEGSVYDFLSRVLLTASDDEDTRARYVEFAMKFQQLTAPITAKGVEDTAFYRSVRLAALNEVGGDPGRFGTSVDEFHRQNASRAAHHPHAMITTATHDMKRGEDVRARLAILSEAPDRWRAALARWSRLNRKHRGPVSALAEYLIYQTILSAWPIELLDGELDPEALAHYTDRISAYLRKAAREAKLRTNWTRPDERYELALDEFVRTILDPDRAPEFITSIRAGARQMAAAGAINGLAQIVLKVTAPGVPDTYQGTELWDLSLVDPDNRRPVDFTIRDAAVRSIDGRLANGTPREELAADLLAAWPDGRIKLYVLSTLLRHRATAGWPADGYDALSAVGDQAEHVVTFARNGTIVAVPRLPWTLAHDQPPLGKIWTETAIPLGEARPRTYRDVLTGRTVDATIRDGRPLLALADIFAILPVAVLEPVFP